MGRRRGADEESDSSSDDSSGSRSSAENATKDNDKRRRRHEEKRERKRLRREEKRKRRERKRSRTTTSRDDGDDDARDFGPPLPASVASQMAARTDFGAALLPGEGAAIAQFVRMNERIPRRGEVGYSGEEIKNLESLGYVMSGSRHARMEAVRKRKESQVMSAEEKRAMALDIERRRREREETLMAEMRRLLPKDR